jgi:hypothetical protein
MWGLKMSNMSYCRFQNTLSDLRDCQSFLSEFLDIDSAEKELSSEEFKAMKKLITLCKQIAKENE